MRVRHGTLVSRHFTDTNSFHYHSSSLTSLLPRPTARSIDAHRTVKNPDRTICELTCQQDSDINSVSLQIEPNRRG
jgi:hypothetical protein